MKRNSIIKHLAKHVAEKCDEFWCTNCNLENGNNICLEPLTSAHVRSFLEDAVVKEAGKRTVSRECILEQILDDLSIALDAEIMEYLQVRESDSRLEFLNPVFASEGEEEDGDQL